MARKYLGTAASGSNDLIKQSDLSNGWQNGLNWGRVDSTLYQITGKGVSSLSTITPAANTAFAQPFFCTRAQTFTHIGLRVTTLLSTATCKMAIYNDLASIGQPGTLLLDCGSVGLTVTGAREITINVNLLPGLYWLVYNLNLSGAAISSEGTSLCEALSSSFTSVTSLSRSVSYSTAFGNESGNTWTASTQAAAIMWLRN